MATFRLKIITSRRIFYNGPCYMLIIPALDGEKAVMAHHEEMIIAIEPGEMRIQFEENGEWEYAAIGQGFCQIANNRATLLADLIERPEEVDANRARARALVRLKETERYIQ